MPRILIITTLFFVLTLPASAQQAEEAGEPADTTETGTEIDGAAGEIADTADEDPGAATAAEADDAASDDEEEEVDDSDLDEQSYEEDDDDFVPTEEIPADEPIPFPSNI